VGHSPLDPVCTPVSDDVELSASRTSVLVTCQARDDLTTALGTAQLAATSCAQGSVWACTSAGVPPVVAGPASIVAIGLKEKP